GVGPVFLPAADVEVTDRLVAMTVDRAHVAERRFEAVDVVDRGPRGELELALQLPLPGRGPGRWTPVALGREAADRARRRGEGEQGRRGGQDRQERAPVQGLPHRVPGYPRGWLMNPNRGTQSGGMATAATTPAEGNEIETKVPARLDRLPWAKWHWMVVIGLGTVWILDGLEVTIIGSIGVRLTEGGSGISLDASQIGSAAACYVAGACVGALFFGQLTDRFGRKKLFLVTLGLYIVATVATGLAWTAWYFFACRFLTGMGIGGEYAAINSAIDELIPARLRGRVNLMINGSYWVGASVGALLTVPLLDTSIFAMDFGWRMAFLIGAVLGVGILIVRSSVPESPRWLFIHGRDDEAEEIVGEIEGEVRTETGEELEEVPDDAKLTIHQRATIPFREIASVAIHKYPKR